MKILFWILLVWIGYMIGSSDGWRSAHVEVARECVSLNGFYVGDQTFSCSLKK